jgi:RNA polymerase sigma factor (sigma-70 family)
MTTAMAVSSKAAAAGSGGCGAAAAGDLISFLRRRAQFLVGSDSDAWDLVQDALERALHRWPTEWAGSDDARRWLTVVLRNLHIDRVRSASWRASATIDPDDLSLLAAPDTEELPLWRTVDVERVEAGMARLPKVQRRILLMQAEGKSLREIGQALGVNPATIGTQLFRAKRRMRALLGLPAPAPPRRRKRRPRAAAAVIDDRPAPVTVCDSRTGPPANGDAAEPDHHAVVTSGGRPHRRARRAQLLAHP